MAKMQFSGMTMGQARHSLDRMVETQAAKIGVSHVYIYAALIFGLAAVMVWFVQRLRGSAPGPAEH